jgi:hypothetical protein
VRYRADVEASKILNVPGPEGAGPGLEIQLSRGDEKGSVAVCDLQVGSSADICW